MKPQKSQIAGDNMTILPKLTRKQKAFADDLLANPKMSATESAERNYDVLNRLTAKSIATENLAKPAIQAYLHSYDDLSQETITEMMMQREDKRLAFDAAKDIQDRLHGKARQGVDISSNSVSLTIDLTSALELTETA